MMHKNKVKTHHFQIYRGFLYTFFSPALDGKSKDLLLKIIGGGVANGIIRGESKNKDRAIKRVNQLLKHALVEGKPIFKKITYQAGKVHYELTDAALEAKEKSRQYAVVPADEFCRIRSKNAKGLYLKMLFCHKFEMLMSYQEISNLFGSRKRNYIWCDIIRPFLRLIKQKTTIAITKCTFSKGVLFAQFKMAYDGFCYVASQARRAFRVFTERWGQDPAVANYAIKILSMEQLDKLDRRLVRTKSTKVLDSIKNYAYVAIINEVNKALLTPTPKN